MADSDQRVSKAPETSAAERTRDRDVFVPYADIYEDDTGLTLVADMPGVSPEGVDVRVEKDALLILGKVPEMQLANGNPVYTEYKTGDHERQFNVSQAVDTDKIEASMKDGVLTVRLPKIQRARERKIEVKPG